MREKMRDKRQYILVFHNSTELMYFVTKDINTGTVLSKNRNDAALLTEKQARRYALSSGVPDNWRVEDVNETSAQEE